MINPVINGLNMLCDTRPRIPRLPTAIPLLLILNGGCGEKATDNSRVSTLAYERAYEAYTNAHYVKAERLALVATEWLKQERSPHKPSMIDALELAGSSASKRYSFSNAILHWTAAAALTDKAQDSLEWARAQSGLANALLGEGKYFQAESLSQQLLVIFTGKKSPEHADTLAIREILALALNKQGKYAEADLEHQTVLRIRERLLGRTHPDTLRTRHNLAGVLRAEGRLREAEAEYREILEMKKSTLGPEHPDTMSSQMGLANVLSNQGKGVEAETEHRAVLKVYERVLGPDHPRTVDSLYNLALCLECQGNLAGAREFAMRAVEGGRKVLPAEHPDRKDYERLYQDLMAKK